MHIYAYIDIYRHIYAYIGIYRHIYRHMGPWAHGPIWARAHIGANKCPFSEI